MNIEKVPGIGPLAPKSSGRKAVKPTDGNFSDALKKASTSDAPAPADQSAEAKEAERLRLVNARIQAGYYDRPDILDATAEKLLNKGKVK